MCYGEIFSEAMVRARKEHKCITCGKPIHPGRIYHKQVGTVDGDFATWKSHGRCRAALYASDAFDEDGCLYDGKRHIREFIEAEGWVSAARKIHKELKNLMKLRKGKK